MHKLLLTLFISLTTIQSKSQQFEIEQLLLNVEKLNQFREILQQMYDSYKLLEEGYNQVRDISSGNYKLHEAFLDGLYLVNPEIKRYYKVAEIIRYQAAIIKEYRSTFKTFNNSGLFKMNQLDYFSKVYKKLFDESIGNLEDLAIILTERKTRMNDQERLQAIDRIHESMQKKLMFLRDFNRQHTILAIEKLRDQSEQQTIKELHGLPPHP